MGGKQRNIRKRRVMDEQDALSDEEVPKISVEDTKLLQKQRQRRTGIETGSLAVAEKASNVGEAVPTGGPDVLDASFKQERRQKASDEDPHMKKYIEEQLAKRLGTHREDDVAQPSGQGIEDDEALALRARQVDTELAPTWVTGILEVPLTLEHKLKNIEETEEAKKRMLLASGAAAFEEEDEDSTQGHNQQSALRRGMYPVHFGRQREGEADRLQASLAKKQRMREIQREKKMKKKQEFEGW